ncbi:MAG: hypothetical protein ABSD02_23130 [Steroidobacteraceae bacterium]|jgi:DNA-binding response OmpR family regulator
MKILHIEKQVIAKLAPSLAEAGHAVTSIKDEKAALEALGGHRFQLVLLSSLTGNESMINAIKALRKGETSKNLYVMLLAQEASEEYLVRAYDAGADSALRTPCGLPLILAKVRASRRVAPLLDDSGADAIDPKASPLDRVNQSSTWKQAPTRACEVAAKFLTLEVSVDEVASTQEPIHQACMITLSSAEHQLEMRIALGAGESSGRRLAVHLFGPEGVDLVPDMLSELSNIMMGTLKTALGMENFAFTGGLPQPLDKAELLRPAATYAHQFAFALKMVDAAILMHVSLRSKANLFLPPMSLRDGMVLAKDIFNARGLLIVQKGTRLSDNMIEKINSFVPPKSLMEVVAP